MTKRIKPKRYQSSITKRLFFNVMIIVLSFALVVMISNAFFLRPLYTMYSEREVKNAVEELIEVDYSAGEQEWRSAVNDIERDNHFEVMIFEDTRVIYSSSSQPRWLPAGIPTQIISEILSELEHEMPDINQMLDNFDQYHPRRNNLIFAYGQKGDYTILVTQILSPVNNTIRQTNLVILLVTSLFLLLTLLIAFRLSKRFTRPIKKIQSTVANIADLNFNSACDVHTGDELEHLADDVNMLSDRLKETLHQLQVQNEQLEKDIISQRQFISNASHELRTPLSLIKGYADEIGSDFVPNVEQQKLYVNIISEEANKMSRLLKEMLDLSRMESGRMALEIQSVSVNQLIKDFIDKYDGYINDHHLDLTLELTQEDSTGLADPMRFEQILANYLSNAAKYGDIQHIVKISTQVKGDVIRINMFNSGDHIPVQTLENIWDRFYKHDKSRSEKEGSYGLGLSIVAAIMALSGQRYGAENVAGGVNFWFDVKRDVSEDN